MRKKIIIYSSLFVAIAGGAIFYTASVPPIEVLTAEDTPKSQTISPKPSLQPVEQTSQPSVATSTVTKEPTEPGKYVAYESDSVVKATKGTKLLFFHAPWCSQCQALDKDIKATNLPDNLTIFKVDYDSANSLRAKYGVTLQTTIVKVDDNGNLVQKFVAYAKPNFATVKLNLLN